jgi:hypothetical protein
MTKVNLDRTIKVHIELDELTALALTQFLDEMPKQAIRKRIAGTYSNANQIADLVYQFGTELGDELIDLDWADRDIRDVSGDD